MKIAKNRLLKDPIPGGALSITEDVTIESIMEETPVSYSGIEDCPRVKVKFGRLSDGKEFELTLLAVDDQPFAKIVHIAGLSIDDDIDEQELVGTKLRMTLKRRGKSKFPEITALELLEEIA